MARAIKAEIRQKQALTCSIGVAPLKFLAKIASDMHKPDGLTVIFPEEVAERIAVLPIEKVPGVGRKARQQLSRLGIRQLGDVCRFKPVQLTERLGKFGHRLMELAQGRDATRVTVHAPAKSISSECTLPADTRDRGVLRRHLLSQSQEVGRQLRRQGYLARTITLKLKQSDFRQLTRSFSLTRPSHASETIFRTAAALLDQQSLETPIRLIGVGASALVGDTTPQQVSLFESREHQATGWEKVDRAVDRITARFGQSAVHRGSLDPPEDIGRD